MLAALLVMAVTGMLFMSFLALSLTFLAMVTTKLFPGGRALTAFMRAHSFLVVMMTHNVSSISKLPPNIAENPFWG
jgi:hypothetical protein